MAKRLLLLERRRSNRSAIYCTQNTNFIETPFQFANFLLSKPSFTAPELQAFLGSGEGRAAVTPTLAPLLALLVKTQPDNEAEVEVVKSHLLEMLGNKRV